MNALARKRSNALKKLDNVLADYTGGANNAIAALIGAPVDLVNRYTVQTPKPVLGSEWIRDRMHDVDIGTEGDGVAGFLGGMSVPAGKVAGLIEASAQVANAQTPTGALVGGATALGGDMLGGLLKRKPAASNINGSDGKPLSVYHGTNAKFDEFDPAKGKEYGIYTTPKKSYASRYGDNVHEMQLDIKNPLIVDSKGDISPRDLTKADIDRLVSEGYDGIVSITAGRPIEQADEIIAFRADQVRRILKKE